MAKTKVSLPTWATLDEGKDEVRVDVSVAYPRYLAELGEKASAYIVGGIRLCITRDIANLFAGQPVPVVRFVPGVSDEASERDAVRQQWVAANLMARDGSPYTEEQKLAGLPGKDDDKGFRDGKNIVARMRAIRAAKAIVQE